MTDANSPTPRPYPGPWSVDVNPYDLNAFQAAIEERNRRVKEWELQEIERVKNLRQGSQSPKPYRHLAITLIRLTTIISLLLFGTIAVCLVLWLASLIFSREP